MVYTGKSALYLDRKGGIKSSRVNILDYGIPSCTLSPPIYMCGPYGANYDSEKIMLYPVYSREAVMECESLKWYYESIESQHMAHSIDIGYNPNEE